VKRLAIVVWLAAMFQLGYALGWSDNGDHPRPY
jgi:hypothetical protein